MNNVFGHLGATYTVIRDEGSKLFDGHGVTLIPFQVVIGPGAHQVGGSRR